MSAIGGKRTLAAMSLAGRKLSKPLSQSPYALLQGPSHPQRGLLVIVSHLRSLSLELLISKLHLRIRATAEFATIN